MSRPREPARHLRSARAALGDLAGRLGRARAAPGGLAGSVGRDQGSQQGPFALPGQHWWALLAALVVPGQHLGALLAPLVATKGASKAPSLCLLGQKATNEYFQALGKVSPRTQKKSARVRFPAHAHFPGATLANRCPSGPPKGVPQDTKNAEKIWGGSRPSRAPCGGATTQWVTNQLSCWTPGGLPKTR